jgi:hypothetical protein
VGYKLRQYNGVFKTLRARPHHDPFTTKNKIGHTIACNPFYFESPVFGPHQYNISATFLDSLINQKRPMPPVGTSQPFVLVYLC